MHRELESAFRRTRYRVTTAEGELVLRVNQPEPELAALLHASDTHCAALLTAFNPGGRRQAPFRNHRAQRRLQRELEQQGYAMLRGRNEDPRGLWPAEPSLLVLDLHLPEAWELAAQHGQAAFLWMNESGVPWLVATTAPPG